MTGRASDVLLDALHGMVAGSLKDELERAIRRAEANPGDPDCAINPQLLDKVMKFLASNGVSAPASSPRVDRLAVALDELDIDKLALSPHAH